MDRVLLEDMLLAMICLWVPFLSAQLVALAVVPTRRKPGAAKGWLLLIFFLPLLGWLLYGAIGSPRLSPRRRREQQTMNQRIMQATQAARDLPELDSIVDVVVDERYQPVVELVERLGGLPAFAGSSVELLPGYQRAIEQIAADIDRAQRYVHLLYYIFADDSSGGVVVDALVRAAQRGVACRVLVDWLGNRRYTRALFARLRAAGVECHQVLPLQLLGSDRLRPDLRNHRKLVVIDGEVGYTGSQNLIEPNYHFGGDIVYEELVARVSGPIAIQLDAAFLTDWFGETGVLLTSQDEAVSERYNDPIITGDVLAQVLPSGSAYNTENNLQLFVTLLYLARVRAVITTPYFVPDESLLLAITSAARRGVAVQLIVSSKADQFLVSRAQMSYYEELLEAGVQIMLFKPPVLLHSKYISIDDDIAVIGSSNMDVRSLQLNLELSLVLYDRGVAQALHTIEQSYIARSEPLNLRTWRAQHSIWRLLMLNSARLLSELL